jgi:hypothetical protein
MTTENIVLCVGFGGIAYRDGKKILNQIYFFAVGGNTSNQRGRTIPKTSAPFVDTAYLQKKIDSKK